MIDNDSVLYLEGCVILYRCDNQCWVWDVINQPVLTFSPLMTTALIIQNRLVNPQITKCDIYFLPNL